LNKHESYSLADDKSTNPRLFHHLLSISFLPAIFISNKNAWNKPGLQVLDFPDLILAGWNGLLKQGAKLWNSFHMLTGRSHGNPKKLDFFAHLVPGQAINRGGYLYKRV
jgi:hypothetical protein